MTEFNVQVDESVGGWFGISIYGVDEILSSPDVLTNNNSSAVTFAQTNSMLDLLPIGEKIDIKEPPKNGKPGTNYRIGVDFEICMQSKEIDDALGPYFNKEVVVLATKRSQEKRMYGSKLFPLQLTYTHIHGKRMEDGERYKVNISGEIPQRPVYYVEPESGEEGQQGPS